MKKVQTVAYCDLMGDTGWHADDRQATHEDRKIAVDGETHVLDLCTECDEAIDALQEMLRASVPSPEPVKKKVKAKPPVKKRRLYGGKDLNSEHYRTCPFEMCEGRKPSRSRRALAGHLSQFHGTTVKEMRGKGYDI